MEDLNIDEVRQLLNFYKQKSSDLELQVLQSQIKINKLIANQIAPVPATKTVKTKSNS
jgi:hypothetical protein